METVGLQTLPKTFQKLPKFHVARGCPAPRYTANPPDVFLYYGRSILFQPPQIHRTFEAIKSGAFEKQGMELAKIYSGKTTHYDVLVLDNVFYSERVSQLKRWGIKFQQIDITEKNNLQTAICDADIIDDNAKTLRIP